MDQKNGNFLSAIFLCMIVLLGWQYFVVEPKLAAEFVTEPISTDTGQTRRICRCTERYASNMREMNALGPALPTAGTNGESWVRTNHNGWESVLKVSTKPGDSK